MPATRLPRHRADAWDGGFPIASPAYTASISACAGTVVAATERMYLLRPGAAQFQARDIPEGAGDASCVAVEPRGPGNRQRIAVASYDTLRLYDGEGVAAVQFPADHDEIVELLWAPDVHHCDPRSVLYVRFPDLVLQLVPDGSPLGSFVQLGDQLGRACAMATDGAGGFAFATLDEESWSVEVWFLAKLEPQLWYRRSFDAPAVFSGTQLAIAGKSVAVSFDAGTVWMTRDIKEHDFAEVEATRGSLQPHQRGRAPIAFEGAEDDAALFAAVRDTSTRQSILRVDAGGAARRIAEVESGGDDPGLAKQPPIHELAWDSTRRTLWCAAGRAGVMFSTAPGAPSPLGAGAAS